MRSDRTDQPDDADSRPRPRTKDRLFFRRITWIRVVLAFLAGTLVALASTVNAVDRLMIWFKFAPDALQLAHEDARARFSREFVRAAWGRWFLMQRYISAIEIELSPEDKSKIWARYLEARDEWNRDLMVNILSIDQFYGADKRYLFEGPIQSIFGSLHACLASLHYERPQVACPISKSRELKAIKDQHERLNFLLYCFATGLSEKSKAISDCRSLVD